MNHQTKYSSTLTFRKILFFTIPIILYLLWRNDVFQHDVFVETSETQITQKTKESIELMSSQCWNSFFLPVITGMDSTANRIWKNQGNAEDNIQEWVVNHNINLSSSVWLINKKWPVRYIDDSIWKQPEIKALSKENRKKVFDFLFKEESYQDKKSHKYYLGPVIDTHVLPAPLVTIGMVTNAIRDVLMIETKLNCKQLFELFSDKQWAISNEKGDFVLSSSDTISFEINKSKNFKIQIDEHTIKSSIPISNSGWVLYNMQTKQTNVLTTQFAWPTFGYVTTILILIFSIWSYLLAKWIDRPLNHILLVANEIARGDFSIRIPMPRSRRLKQLATLINYMAEETERLLQMNVGSIITEKKKTETILRNIADGVIVTDPQNKLIVINTVAENWFGVKQKSVFKKPVSKAIHIKSLIHLFEKLSYKHQKSSVEFNYQVVGDDNERIFHAHASQVYDEDKRLIGTVTILRDITKEYEADKLKTELVSMVAHELKSPMTSIFGFSELLLEEDLTDDQRKEYANVIMTESSRLTDLINKFLDLTRLEVGRTEIRMIPFDLEQLVDKMIENSRSLYQKKNIHIIKDVAEKMPFAFADPDMIEQVLLNLLSNAIKYSPKNSKIGIEIKKVDDRLAVSVIDNGYGIPKESLPNIFKKFYRVSETNETSSAEGSGLGLALAKEIIQHHGGTINVQSKLGVGSVFNFTLPKTDILDTQTE